MIEYLPLGAINGRHAAAIADAIAAVTASGRYLLGEATRRFEAHYADYIGTRHCIGCGNGLDALWLIFRAYKELGLLRDGDEVMVPANTYIASLLAISENGLVPVPVEPRLDTLELDDALLGRSLTARTRALLLVHLYGRCAFTQRVADFCRQHGLLLVEDNAQAHGCRAADGRRTGSLGDAAGHSFYPGKNLGALGDAGAVTTNDDRLADCVRALGNYGSREKYVNLYRGRNSRIDEVQAAVLDAKLTSLDADNALRRAVADHYCAHLRHPRVALPARMPEGQNVFHIFPLLCDDRDALRRHLEARGVQTLVHYPVPPHRQACYAPLLGHLQLPVTDEVHRRELSLPCHPAMTLAEAAEVAEAVNQWN